MKYKGEGKEQVRAWVYSEEVEKVLTDFAKEMEIAKADLEKDILSAEIIDKWVEWVEKDKNWQKARAVLYDFVEDTIENEKFYQEYHDKDVYEKWMLYKAGELLKKVSETEEIVLEDISTKFTQIRRYFSKEEHNNEKKLIMELHDPDGEIRRGQVIGGSRLLQNIYEILWPELTKKEYMKHFVNNNESIWICSDTMTSEQQRMNNFLQIIKNDDFEKVRKEISDNQRYSLRLCIELYLRYTNFDKYTDKKEKTDFIQKICETVGEETEKQFQQFLECWHMVGNYCPVPRGLNSARSNFGKRDYWDLTLKQIYQWYKYDENKMDKKENPLTKLLHIDELWKNCTEWLRWFGQEENKKHKEYDGFHNFVDTFLLQDYVDINDNYKPVPFWDGHSWDKPDLPEDETDINKALQEINRRIVARSLRMVAACRKKLAEQENES